MLTTLGWKWREAEPTSACQQRQQPVDGNQRRHDGRIPSCASGGVITAGSPAGGTTIEKLRRWKQWEGTRPPVHPPPACTNSTDTLLGGLDFSGICALHTTFYFKSLYSLIGKPRSLRLCLKSSKCSNSVESNSLIFSSCFLKWSHLNSPAL